MIRCRVLGHKKSLSSTGYGGGVLDYYCARCQKGIVAVPLAEMNDAERERVIGYGGFSTMMTPLAAPGDGLGGGALPPADTQCVCGCPRVVHDDFTLEGIIEPACYGSQAGLVCVGGIYHSFTPAPPDAGGGA